MCYLDNAATTYPKPIGVVRALCDAVTLYGGNPGRGGHKLAARAAAEAYAVREKAARLFGGAPESTVFTSGATASLNIAMSGLLAGGEVLTSDLEHNAVRRPLAALSRRGVSRTAVCTDGSAAEVSAAFEKAITADTRAVCLCAVSNVTGRRLPWESIGDICRRHGLLFILDAAQAAGAFDIDMRRDGISALCAPGHKGLYGAAGVGVLLLAPGVNPAPLLFGGSGGASASPVMPTLPPERYEAGTLPLPAIAALGAGLDYVFERTPEEIGRHERDLADGLYARLCELRGIRLYGAPESGTFIFNIEGMASEAVAAELDRCNIAVRAGLHCAPDAHKKLGTLSTGAVRVSFGAFNTASDAEKVLAAAKKIANSI